MSDLATLIECLKPLIALSLNDCECFENDRPDDYNSTTTGYSITDGEYGLPFPVAAYKSRYVCKDKSIWQLLDEARADAIRDLKDDLSLAIYKDFDNKFAVFNGNIGKQERANFNTVSKLHVGQCWDVCNIKGGCIVVDKISLGVTCTRPITVYLYSNQESAPLKSVEISATANQWVTHKLDEPWELPLYKEGCDDLKYYFTYERPAGCQPLQNKIKCCNKKYGWTQFMKANGFETNDLSQISAGSSYGYGLSIGICFQCKTLDWLCSAKEFGGFSSKATIARTIGFKAAIKCLTQFIVEGKSPFNCSVAKLEEMRKQRQQWYNTNITHMAQNIPSDANDCLKCKSDNFYQKKSLWS